MQRHELQIGDIAHCDASAAINCPFIGKVIRCDATDYEMEVLFISELTRENAALLHTQQRVAKTALQPFMNKQDLPSMKG